MAAPESQDKIRDATLPCPRCRGEMHPLFLYEDKEPDTWLCFDCGHVEWISLGKGKAIPSVDQ